MTARIRLTRFAILATCVSIFGCGLAAGAGADFALRTEIRAGVDGNIAVVGEERPSDNVMQVLLDLFLTLNSEVTTFNFRYRPSLINYKEFTELDHDSHRLRTNLDHSISERIIFLFAADYFRGQYQGIISDSVDQPTTLVPRTNIERGTVRIGWQAEASERATWAWGIGAATVKYEDRPLQGEFQNWKALLIDLDYDRGFSKRTSAGFAYDLQYIDYDSGGTLQVHTLLAVTRMRLGAHTQTRFGLGGVLARAETESVSDPAVEAEVIRVVGQRTRLTAGLSQRVSPGTGLQRATRDQGAYLAWNFTHSWQWSLNINAAYWNRTDLGSLASDARLAARTAVTGETLTWTPIRPLSVGLFHWYNAQLTSESVADGLDTDYHSGGFFVRWNILGKRGIPVDSPSFR